jgi:hypothetical protein
LAACTLIPELEVETPTALPGKGQPESGAVLSG